MSFSLTLAGNLFKCLVNFVMVLLDPSIRALC